MIRSNGRPFNRTKPVNKPDELVQAVERLYREGEPAAKIARLFRIARQTVSRWAEKFGWERPSTGDEK